jgi:hypothetical protein
MITFIETHFKAIGPSAQTYKNCGKYSSNPLFLFSVASPHKLWSSSKSLHYMTSSTRFNLQTSNLSSECLFHHQPRCQPCTIRSLLLRVHAVLCSAFVASPVSTERSGSCDEWFVFTCTTPGCMREQPTLEVELALQMSTANKISSPDTSESSESFH